MLFRYELYLKPRESKASETKNAGSDTRTGRLSAEVVADLERRRKKWNREGKSHRPLGEQRGSRRSGRRRDGGLQAADGQLCRADPQERGRPRGAKATGVSSLGGTGAVQEGSCTEREVSIRPKAK